MTRNGSPIVRTLAVALLALLFIAARAPERPASRWAIVVASSGTEEMVRDVDLSAPGGRIAEVLGASYGFDQVFEIYNEEATLKGLYFGLDELLSNVRPRDSIFLFVALPATDVVRARTPGLHWVPWDGRPEEGLALISPPEVIGRLGEIPDANILLVSPSCLTETRYGYADQMQMKTKTFSSDAGVIFNALSGCSRTPQPEVFAAAVAEGLESGLGENLSEFTSEDLAAFLKAKLRTFRVEHLRQYSTRGSMLFVRERQALDPGLLEAMETASSAEERVDSIYRLVEFVFNQSQEQRGSLANDLAGRLLAVSRSDDSTAVRNAALQAIGRLKPDGMLDMLGEIARTDTSSVALEAIRTIENLAGAEAVELLEGLLDSDRPSVRTGAIQALGRLRSSASLPKIVERMATDFDTESNLAALEAILLLGENKAAAVESVVALLEREPGDQDVRRRAISALGSLGRPEALPVLREWLRGGDKVLAAAAANALARIEAPANMRPGIERSLIAVLSDDELADAAARALGRHGSQAAVDPLIQRVIDPTTQARTRAAAVNALGDIGDGAAVGTLIGVVWGDELDPDRDVRLAASRALAKLGDPAALRPLTQVAGKDDDVYVRGEAAKAVDSIRAARVRSATENREVANLIEAIGDPDEATRSRAEAGLASLPADDVVPALIDTLDDDNPYRRSSAVFVLGYQANSSTAIDALIRATGDEHPSVRAAAYGALGSVPDSRVVDILLGAVDKEKNWEPRQSATFALIEQSNQFFNAGEMSSARELAETAYAMSAGETYYFGSAEALITLALIDATDGNLDAARESLEKARGIREEYFGRESAEVAEALLYLGGIAEAQGERRYAEDLFFEILGIRERIGGSDEYAAALDNLARFYERGGDSESATAFAERAERARTHRESSRWSGSE